MTQIFPVAVCSTLISQSHLYLIANNYGARDWRVAPLGLESCTSRFHLLMTCCVSDFRQVT